MPATPCYTACVRNSRTVTSLMSLLRVGMGLFFLGTGLQKISGLDETAQFLVRSHLYLPEWLTLPLACTGVSMELVVGACLLLRFHYRGAAAWGVMMCSVFLLLYAQAWVRGLTLSCNCFGSTHAIDNYPLDTGMRILLLGAMLLILWDSRQETFSFGSHRKLDVSEL